MKAFAAGILNGAGAPKVTPEGMERSRVRTENAWLKREVDILKKAPTSFARNALCRTPGLMRTPTASP